MQPTKPNASGTKRIKREFNQLAQQLGSKARIGGTSKKPIMQEHIGDCGGFETVVKVDGCRFTALIKNFPELIKFIE